MSQPELIASASTGSDPRAHWSDELRHEFDTDSNNGIVGSVLVSETDKLRVWHLKLAPGERCPFHTHVLDYFWTCHSHGKTRGWYDDGRIQDVTHFPGDTSHFRFAAGEKFTHCIQNTGDTELLYTTVEFLDSANPPYKIPASVKLDIPA